MEEKRFQFKILKEIKNSGTRLGEITVKRNGKIYKVKTPAIAIVGTKAAVKAVSPEELKQAKTQIVLANTYHLMLQEQEKTIKKSGGLNKFMNWDGLTITDSGGFQVFSLGFGLDDKIGKIGFFKEENRGARERKGAKAKPKNLKITEDGVLFKSHKDGREILLNPEKSVKIQECVGADIIFAFDECTSPFAGYDYTKFAMERTHRWALRCLHARSKKSGQALFGIVQGGDYEDLRKTSAKFIGSLPFDGIGLGGSLGDSKESVYKILEWVMPHLPKNLPRHILGIGDFHGVIESVKRGADLFDCVSPTREARNGRLYTRTGFLQIKNEKFKNDNTPIEKDCGCYACKNNFSRAYIRHLLREREMFGKRLTTLHNIYFINKFFEDIRENINDLDKWGKIFFKKFDKGA